MITNHEQTCIIHFVDCRKALHSFFTHHTRKCFGCERRRGLHMGRHVVTRVDVFGTTCAADVPLGLASGKLPSAHIASYEKGRCCQAPPGGETGFRWVFHILVSLHLHSSSSRDHMCHQRILLKARFSIGFIPSGLLILLM